MDDDWSLKGKDIFRTIEDTWISSYNIDTLRKKLIEDIDIIDCTEKSKLKKWEIIEEVLDIIDKRFGVK